MKLKLVLAAVALAAGLLSSLAITGGGTAAAPATSTGATEIWCEPGEDCHPPTTSTSSTTSPPPPATTAPPPDSDGDGVADSADNCVWDPNPGQEDDDGDAVGNVCDPNAPNDFVYDATEEGSVSLEITRPRAGDGAKVACRDYHAGIKVVNRFTRRRYFSYTQSATVCYNGATIRSIPFHTAFGDTRWPWSFRGNLSLAHGEPLRSSVPLTAQGRFEACLPKGVGCINSYEPWIWLTVYGDGSAYCHSNVSKTCSIVYR
jgi:hypothetical protein